MGFEDDLENLYQILDSPCRGYVDSQQIQDFHQTLYLKKIGTDQVDAALKQVCGDQKVCSKKQFVPLLLELERRRTIEERAWWDFKSLDMNGMDQITIQDALFLFKITLGDKFTMIYWGKFVLSRNYSKEPTSFEEVKMWLCNIPDGSSEPCSNQAIFEEISNLQTEKNKMDYRNFKKIKALQDDDFVQTLEAREKQQYQDKFRQGARRKLNRWVQLGVESMMFDDGVDVGRNIRNQVTVQDLLEAMDEKYDILREKLIWESLRSHIGETIWSTMPESEREEQVLKIKTKHQQLIAQNKEDKVAQLSIGYQNYSSRLVAMMGYHREEQLQFMQDTQEKRGTLRADGKSEEEIVDTLTVDYSKLMEGSTTCGELLCDLQKRHMAEREFLVAVLKGVQGRVLFSAEMVSEYILYVQQQILASREGEGFEHATIATGLSERPQEFKSERFDADRDRHELLALERLQMFVGKRPNRVKDDVFSPDVKGKGIVDMQIEVMRMLLKKHYQEKEMMLYLLKGKESGTWRSVARRKNQEQRDDRLKELRIRRSNWRQLNSQKMTEERTQHLKILFEGMGIYHERRRNEVSSGSNLTDQQVSAVALADLQQLQAQEVERILLEMQHKSCKELFVIWQHEHAAWVEEWLDNISAIFFGTFHLSDEEREIAQLLQDKYETLREKLFLEMLVNQYGLTSIWRMTDEEKHRQIVKKKLEERELRQDGDLEDVEQMFASVLKNKESFPKLVGNLRILKQKQIQEKLATRKAEGKLDSDSESDSDSDDELTAGDLLSDLQLRSDRELDIILAMINGDGTEKATQSEKMELQLRLHLERMRAQQALDFTESALVVGLAERGKLNWEKSLKSDQRRYNKLAVERFRIRQSVREANLAEPLDKEDKVLPKKGDMMAWRLAVLQEVLKYHRAEREILLSIMMDKGSDDLRDAAKQMTQEEREQRMMELRKKAESLNLDVKSDNESNQDILEEVGAIKSVLRKQSLETRTETAVTQEDVSISLMVDLQEIQDKEIERIIEKMHGMTDDRLSRLRMEFIRHRQLYAGRNTLIAFTRYDGVADEDSIMKALRKKYDFLKDKCLLDLLKKQCGEAEWAKISERERQRRLMKLKLEEKRLRREGKVDELQKLLGGFLELDLQMHKLMGDSRAEYEDKLNKRRQARQRRQKQGLDDGDEEGLSEDEEVLDISSKNPLDDLQRRFDQEKDALLAKLRGAEKQYLSERERQAELARLKRELRKAQKEDDFSAAALVLGLAERNQAAAEERLKKDRERQEELARKRLEAARQKKRSLKSIQEGVDETVVSNGDRAAMQDGVLKALEQKHLKERQTLLVLLQTEYSEDERLVAENMSGEHRVETMQRLQHSITTLARKQTEERIQLLLEATILKIVSRTVYLTKEGGSEVGEDDVIVTIIADLQDQQDKESEALIKKLVDKENSYLVKIQQELIEETKYGVNANVTLVVTMPDLVKKTDDEELVEALEDKYDALRDKILADALMKQMGAKEWANLSEKERQARLIKLRLQERKLRQEGKFDEASALLGDAAKNQAALAALMGKTRKSQEEQMRERLERRRQRMASGMSEEEAQKLEEEEIQQEEEDMNKKSENILQELENRKMEEKAELLSSLKGDGSQTKDTMVENKYDALRDKVLAEALMKQMGDADWAKLSERERQQKIMQLRLQERKLRKEGKIDEASALLGDAMKADAALALLKEEQRRERERRLRERLAKRKQRAEQGMSEDEISKLEKEEEQKDEEEMKERQVNIMEAIEIIETQDKDVELRLRGELEKEIEDKYDDLKDRLLAELLLKQLGAAEWAKLSERERQARLLKLRLMERRLRMEGKYDDAAALLSDLANSQRALELLQEAARQERERRLRERLAKRKQRMAAGMTLEEALKLEEEEAAEEEKTNKREKQDNVMEAIDTLMSEEKNSLLQKYGKTEADNVEDKYDAMRDKMLTDALIQQMGAAEWAKLSEAERQLKKMQLQLRERQLRREGRYDEADALMGDAIKNQAALEILMEAARKRQAQRLREQLELRKKRMNAGFSEEEIVQMEMEDSVQEEEMEKHKKQNVMEAIENLLDEEKADILSTIKKPDKTEVMKDVERKYDEIRDKILTDTLMKQMTDAEWAKLSEAERQAMKVELKLREREMRRIGKWEEAAQLLGGAAKSEMALQVIREAMRRLQEQKMKERLEARRQRLGAGLTEEEIDKLEEDEKREEDEVDETKKENVMEAIETLLQEEKNEILAQFKKPSQEEETKEIQKNYENLADQILAKALMDQMGKSEWTKLSEQERQAEMLKLRMRERQLRKEGKFDEAAALLGEAAKSQAAMEALLGATQKSQEEKMKERLQKRKERIAMGMTSKEVVALEAEEIKEEEELMKKIEKPKNVLEALDHKIEEEKTALMATLRNQDERLMQERKRQAALAKLRREQRKARQEENFDAAALVIGLAQKGDEVREKDRKRQEQLAKERLEQRKKQIAARKLAKQKGEAPPPEGESVTPPGPVPLPEDENNKQGMQDAVIKEMEIRYQEERDVLVQILSEEESGDRREQARQMSEAMRQRKLSDLKEQRQQWRDGGPSKEDEEEHIEILNKAAALKLESRGEDMKLETGEDIKEEEVQVAILADLQQKQDEEANILMQDLEAKAINTLKQLKLVQFIARNNAWCDTVAATLLETKTNEDVVTEEKLVKALEGKYDALRDKLLMEALMRQVGADEWARLTEKERQARLMKLKLQERRLRQEGKFDEANALLGQAMQNQEDMARLLGDSKRKQAEKMQRRVEMRAQLKAQREAEGLDVSDEALDKAVLAQEERMDALEEKRVKKNILEELSYHYEDEKAALLASVREQDERYRSERERQLALAKLRREQRMLQEEGKFDAAAALFGLSQEHEKARETSVMKDRDRQKQLARDRLAAMKAKREKKENESVLKDAFSQKEILEKMRKAEVDNQQMDAALATTGAGLVGYQVSILEEVEIKHQAERETLHLLMTRAEEDDQMKTHLQNMSAEDLAAESDALRYQRDTWKANAMAALSYANGQNLTGDQLEQYLLELSTKQEEHITILRRSFMIKSEILLRDMKKKGTVAPDKMQEEVYVTMLADLQQKQTSEDGALSTVLSTSADKDDEFLVQLKESQRRARREGWMENLAASLYSQTDITVTVDEVVQEGESKLADLDAELEKEKEEAVKKEKEKKKLGEDYDADAMLAELERQYAAKRKVMMDQLERQRSAAMKKLAARKARQEDKLYEDQAARAMLQNAEKQQARLEESTKEQKSKHSALMQEKLAARREQRRLEEEKRMEEEKQREEEEKRLQEERASKESKESDGSSSSRPSSSRQDAPFGGMQREKTMVDVDMSESQKKALFTALVRDHTRAQLKKDKEQEKHTEALKKRLESRKNKQYDTAMNLIGIGERQKTKLELTKKEEREKQMTMVKERIQKVKFERTQTMMRRGGRNTKAFLGVLDDKEAEVLSQDEKMARAAEKMQENFLKEQALYKAGDIQALRPDSDDAMSISSGGSKPSTPNTTMRPKSSRILKTKDRERLLKEKRAEKKRLKEHASSASAAPDMESLALMLEERKSAAMEATSTFTVQMK